MTGKDLAGLLPLVALLLFGYLLFIRPARKRAQEVTALQNALSTGDEVMLTSGIFATAVAVVDDKVQVAIADGVVITVHRGAIAKIIRDVPADAALGDEAPYEDAPYETDDPDGPTDPEKPGAN